MDILALLRSLGALAITIGLLVGALWLVRRYGAKLPGALAGGAGRRLELVERLPHDARRSLALVRCDDKEFLILLAPEGVLLLDTLDRRANAKTPA